jgi:hypothetical protein
MTQGAIRYPAAGAVFWAEAMPDGSAGERPIAGAPPRLQVNLTSTLPRGISANAGSRGVVLLGGPIAYDHTPTESELSSVPALPTITLAGSVTSLDGRFHPRRFSVTPAAAAPTYIALRPSLQGTRVGEAGAVVLHLRWQDGSPGSWAVLQLGCARGSASFGFAAQADRNGDAIVPLTGLPPLPPSQTSDTMTLSVRADHAQAGQPVADPDSLAAVPIDIGTGFAVQQSFAVTWGMVANAAALKIPGVTLQII